MPNRDSHIDNAKGLLMTLVVLGHLIYPVPNPNMATDALYIFIYLFHMPMFALVSGYLSHASMDSCRLKGEVKKLLVPYVLFVGIQWGILSATGQEPFPLYEGHFGLWFLLSLFCWRLLLPLVTRIPHPLPVTIVIAMLVGMIPQIDLGFSLSRTFVLLPFFLAGHLLRTSGTSIGAKVKKPAAMVILVIALGFSFFFSDLNLQPLLWGGFSYQHLGMPLGLGPILRGFHLAVAFVCGLSFLALVPGDTLPLFSRIGRHSLHVYLLHSLLLVFYRTWSQLNDPLGQYWLALIPLAVGVAWLLSSTPVVRYTNWLVSPLAGFRR